MDFTHLRVNGSRLRQSLEEMAKIGATKGGGVQRLTLSDEDKQARDLFVRWLEELKLKVQVDEMGNIFGRRAGIDNTLSPVLSGSHIDSQPKGGRFDGILAPSGHIKPAHYCRGPHLYGDCAQGNTQRLHRAIELLPALIILIKRLCGFGNRC